MQLALILLVCFSAMFGVALLLSRREGSKAAQLKALKAELEKRAKEQAKANEIIDSVRNMDEHTVRNRLHEIANKQR